MSSQPNETCQIYLITPPQIDDLKAFCAQLDKALSAAPVACLQIRLKDMNGGPMDSSAIIQAARAIVPICHEHETLVLMNDNPNLAKEVGADGVHIGQNDMDYFSSRELLGGDAICLLYTSPSPRDATLSRMPSSA